MTKYLFTAAQKITIQHICDTNFAKGVKPAAFIYALAVATHTLNVEVESDVPLNEINAEAEMIQLMKEFGYAWFDGPIVKLEQ